MMQGKFNVEKNHFNFLYLSKITEESVKQHGFSRNWFQRIDNKVATSAVFLATYTN